MSVSFKPAEGTTASVAAGAPVQAVDPLPDNCHTIIVYNPSGTDTALIGWAQNAGAFDPTRAVRVGPGASLTLAISALSGRALINGDVPFYDITAGVATLEITYVNASTT
jgi:hypothetical protein